MLSNPFEGELYKFSPCIGEIRNVRRERDRGENTAATMIAEQLPGQKFSHFTLKFAHPLQLTACREGNFNSSPK